jgi:hypothetical protein
MGAAATLAAMPARASALNGLGSKFMNVKNLPEV